MTDSPGFNLPSGQSADNSMMLRVILGALVVGLVICLILFGDRLFDFEQSGGVRGWMTELAHSPWGAIGVIGIYMALALTGFPQFVLIAATVFAFGAFWGGALAWFASLCSATMTFYLGRVFGADIVRRYGGDRVNAISAFVGRHGIAASALVRVVPSAPFIIVNMTAGLSHIPYWKFLAGTAAGSLPKIIFVAAVGASFMSFFTTRDPRDLAIIAGAFLAWFALIWYVRRIYTRMRARDAE